MWHYKLANLATHRALGLRERALGGLEKAANVDRYKEMK